SDVEPASLPGEGAQKVFLRPQVQHSSPVLELRKDWAAVKMWPYEPVLHPEGRSNWAEVVPIPGTVSTFPLQMDAFIVPRKCDFDASRDRLFHTDACALRRAVRQADS